MDELIKKLLKTIAIFLNKIPADYKPTEYIQPLSGYETAISTTIYFSPRVWGAYYLNNKQPYTLKLNPTNLKEEANRFNGWTAFMNFDSFDDMMRAATYWSKEIFQEEITYKAAKDDFTEELLPLLDKQQATGAQNIFRR